MKSFLGVPICVGQSCFGNLYLTEKQGAEEFSREDEERLVVFASLATIAIEKDLLTREADDGPGIPNELVSKIFDPFFTTKEAGAGTGLGLSVCYGIVKEHGGELHVKSEEGKGTTFTIELPLPPQG